jgi:hypothetical protein
MGERPEMLGVKMKGQLIYASENKVRVNLRIVTEAKPKFSHVPAYMTAPGQRQWKKDEEGKITTRDDLGICVGMSALWCAHLINEKTDQMKTVPSQGRAQFIQARWEQLRKSAPNTSTLLVGFKAFLEGLGMGVKVSVPSNVQLTAAELANDVRWLDDPGTLMVFCPGHCIGVNRRDIADEGSEGLLKNNYLFDPDRGLYGYEIFSDLDTDMANEYTGPNSKYGKVKGTPWYYLQLKTQA